MVERAAYRSGWGRAGDDKVIGNWVAVSNVDDGREVIGDEFGDGFSYSLILAVGLLRSHDEM